MRSVTVTPVDKGWAVHCDAIENPMIFRSGAKAEEAAKRLAQAWADAGERVELEIQLRDGERAGRFLCVPSAEPAESNSLGSPRLETI